MNDSDNPFEKVELSQKEQLIEFIAIGIAVLLLFGCFMKVMFL